MARAWKPHCTKADERLQDPEKISMTKRSETRSVDEFKDDASEWSTGFATLASSQDSKCGVEEDSHELDGPDFFLAWQT